jgi:hypothetical protein
LNSIDWLGSDVLYRIIQIIRRLRTRLKQRKLCARKLKQLINRLRFNAFIFAALAILILIPKIGCAQAALLIEQPYGFFGVVNPTGHNAVYFERICADTPVRLRRCKAGELGAVLSRYQGMSGYDWVAIPLVPYLYSVEDVTSVQPHIDPPTVKRLRSRYHEAHLLCLGETLRPGNLIKGGWTQLVGAAYERRIYAFRFETTEAQDDALIAKMNSQPNHSHFDLLINNCADFARKLLSFYYPGRFKRGIFPDAGVTTPKQLAHKLARSARKHPEMNLTVFEIPQIPGNRRLSHSNKDVDESLSTTLYAIPIALVSPYLAGGLFVDYLVRGRYRIVPKHPMVLTPDELTAWARPASESQSLVAHSPAVVHPTGAELMISEPVVPAASESPLLMIAEPSPQDAKKMHP